MKVVFHDDFHRVYAPDPSAALDRMQAILRVIKKRVKIINALPATEEQIAAVHTEGHIRRVPLAAGAAIQAAEIGLKEPVFALIRPPGHHATGDSAWGFCYFNNMAVALINLFHQGRIRKAMVLDIDLHYGDGTVNILGGQDHIAILNPGGTDRRTYLRAFSDFLQMERADIIGISAGFDNHAEDWGGLLMTEDYRQIGKMVREVAEENGAGYFGILEGGYNHRVLGKNVLAFLEGMTGI